mgnify:CR=1 FL=1
MEETVKLKKAKKTRVIPGFKLTMGITVTMLSLIVLIPLASVMVYSLKLSPSSKYCLYALSQPPKSLIVVHFTFRLNLSEYSLRIFSSLGRYP